MWFCKLYDATTGSWFVNIITLSSAYSATKVLGAVGWSEAYMFYSIGKRLPPRGIILNTFYFWVKHSKLAIDIYAIPAFHRIILNVEIVLPPWYNICYQREHGSFKKQDEQTS